jgi:hypothetical protein
MLPVVAAMMMGTMSKAVAPTVPPSAAPRRGAGPGGEPPLAMLAPMLDANRNGSMIDDVIGMLGGFSKR